MTTLSTPSKRGSAALGAGSERPPALAPSTMYGATPAGLSISLALTLLWVAPAAAEPVRLDQGVVYDGVRGPAAVALDQPIELTFHFRASGPLRRDFGLFVHVEGEEGCRFVQDVELLQRGRPSRDWTEGEVTGAVRWPRAPRCGPGRYEVWVGLWHRETGDRLAVLGGAGHFDRIRAHRLELRPAGAEGAPAPGLHPPLVEPPERPTFVPPWQVLALFGLALLMAVVAVIADRRGWPGAALERLEPVSGRGVSRWVPAAVPVMILAAGVLACLGFVKDDAYISFRYAHNLVAGRGLVFNAGEVVEGYTNFLWTMLMVPADALGADLVQVSDLLGPAASLALILVVFRAAEVIDGPGPALSHLWAATWLASSSSLALWSVGGLEQGLATLLPLAGALMSFQGWQRRERARLVAGGLVLALACLTRPEGHLFVVLIGGAWLGALLRARPRWRLVLRLAAAWAAPLVVVLGPYHLWRLLTFGSLLPNTYLVKAVSGDAVFRAGFHLAEATLEFNLNGVVLALATVGLLARDQRLWRWLSVVVALAFVVYVIKVGTDELMWHRLVLPALPFAALAAGAGLRLVVTAAVRRLPRGFAWLGWTAGWALVLLGAWHNLSFTFEQTRGLGGYGGCTGMNHPDLGKFLTRHSRPGELVAFQDMGATPYHAPDLRFLDLVGLVDRPVAQMLQRYGVHPFVGATRARRGGEFCVALRDEVFERDPEWVVLVPWPDRRQVRDVASRFGHEDAEALLRRYGAFRNTQFDCHLYHDPRFADRYVHVRSWQRSPVYYLSAFARRDVWNRAADDVVLERSPGRLPGPRARLEGGLHLLGGLVEQRQVVERHEVFVTTWWRVPGPRSDDIQVFVHLTRMAPPRARTSLDHPMGDWMYPASRWRPADVIEDRVLIQLPLDLVPGEYEVHAGLFDRATGERIGVTEGPATEDDRLPLGRLEIRPMRHLVDPLIPRTDPAEQRRSPR